MKILLTSDWYIPAVNGVVASVLNLSKGLKERGHEVRILTLSQTHRSYVQDGVTYIGSLPAGIVYPGARLRAALSKKEIRELLEWGPDVVHSNCEFSTFLLARKIAVRLDVPLIHTYHTVYENYTHYFSPSKQWGRKMVKTLTRHIAAQTDCLIAPTQKVKNLLCDYHVFQPVCVVPTGIEQERFQTQGGDAGREAMREQLGIPTGHTVLVFVGRLAKEKNCGELLKAVFGFRHEAVTLLIVGDGPCRRELERQAESLGLGGQVIFTGMAPPEEVGRYYHAADLFVSASASETQGLTYLEALSCGLPMICRRDECLRGVLLDGVNGWQYGTEEEFSDRLKMFLENPGIRSELSCEAARIGRGFSISSFAENAEQVYREQIVLRQMLKQEASA